MGIKRKVKLSSNAIETSLEDAFNEFISVKEAENKSPSTIRNYKQSYSFFKEYYKLDAEKSAKAVTQAMIYQWINKMKNDDISSASINHYLRDVRAFFYYCMEKEYMESFKIKETEAQEEMLKFFKDEDLEKLLEKPRRKDDFVEWRTWMVVNWICGTGNRAGTVCNVKLKDINFHNKQIALSHTKNKKIQTVPLSPSLETALKEYIKMWRSDANPDDFLFPSIGDETLTYNALRLAFTRYCTEREVEQHNLHGLRHNFAKNYIQQGGSEFKLMQILGHSSISMTRRYVKLFSKDLAEDYEKFSLLDNMKK